jgi:hypothetical protein
MSRTPGSGPALATGGAELTGVSTPCTFLDGNICSFLDRAGVMDIPLGRAEIDSFLRGLAGGAFVHAMVAALAEDLAAPARLPAEPGRAAAWPGRSLAFARRLQSRPGRKKAV